MPPRKKAKTRISTDNTVSLLNRINVSGARTNRRRHTTHANIYDIPVSPERSRQNESPEPPEETVTIRDRLRSRQKVPPIPESVHSENEQQVSQREDEQMDDAPDRESHDEELQDMNENTTRSQETDIVEEDQGDDQHEEEAQITQNGLREEAEEEDEELEREPEEHHAEDSEEQRLGEEEQDEEQDEENDEQAEDAEEQQQEEENGQDGAQEVEQEYNEEEDGEERYSTPLATVSQAVPIEQSSHPGTPMDNRIVIRGSNTLGVISPSSQITSTAQTAEIQEPMDQEIEPENEAGDWLGEEQDETYYEAEDEPEDEPESDIGRLAPDLKAWLVETVQMTTLKTEWMNFCERAFDLPNYVWKPMPKLFEDSLMLLARQRELYDDLEDRSVFEPLPPRFQADIANLCTSVFAEIQGILNFPSIPESKHNPVKAGHLVVQLEGYLLPHMAILVILAFKAFTEFGKSANEPFAAVLKLLANCCFWIDDLRGYYESSRNRQRSWKVGVSIKRIKEALERGDLNVHLPAGAIKEETEPMSSSLGYWKYEEVLALRHAMQTYRGSNRYVLIKMHYGSELSQHTIQDLKVKARELGLE